MLSEKEKHMCLFSVFANHNMRKARVEETLTRGDYARHACFRGDDGLVTCIKPGTKVEIANLRLCLHKHYTNTEGRVAQPHGAHVLREQVSAWNNKTQVRGTFVRWHDSHHQYTADALWLEDGLVIHMGWMVEGVTMRIPRKVRKDKGLKRPRNLDKVLGLDQIKAEVLHVDDAAVYMTTVNE